MRTDLWLVLTGFVSGAMNAAAGGGTFLAFPVLIGIASLSPIAANATCTVGLLPGMIASTGGYSVSRSNRARPWRYLFPCFAI